MRSSSDRRRAKRRAQSRIDGLLTMAIVLTIGLVVWVNRPMPAPQPIPLPAQPLALDGLPTMGSPAAPVVLIEHSDFECPYCGAFARETLPAVVSEYVQSGRVRFAYRHVTPPAHGRAVPAAIAAECAGRQGKFWEMHDRLFANQTKLDDISLTAHAHTLGLDLTAFIACQADHAIADRIASDSAEARKLRISGTPSFFIGTAQSDGRVKVTRSFRGAASLDTLREALDVELGDGVLGRILSLRHPAGLAGAVAVGLVGIGLAVRRRRARRVNNESTSP